MSRGKTTVSKKSKSKVSVPVDEETAPETDEVKIPKKGAALGEIKEVIEVEEREDVIGADGKVLEDPLVDPETAEAAESEEASLDEEDINPFGDKWEI